MIRGERTLTLLTGGVMLAMRCKRMVVTFHNEEKYQLLLGPASEFMERQAINDVYRRVHLFIDALNTKIGLGAEHPDQKIQCRLDDVRGFDDKIEFPAKPESILQEALLETIEQRIWAPERTLGFRQRFMNGLREFRESFEKSREASHNGGLLL